MWCTNFLDQFIFNIYANTSNILQNWIHLVFTNFGEFNEMNTALRFQRMQKLCNINTRNVLDVYLLGDTRAESFKDNTWWKLIKAFHFS